MIRLENEYLNVEIAALGAELVRIYDKKTETEILWEADPAFWKRHAPILFPNVGKTWKNVMRIGGKEYATAQHGFARDSEFDCVSKEATSASFLLKDSEATKERYPFPFELTVSYELDGAKILVSWQVKNPGGETMYYTIGAHPAFRFEPGKKKEDYILKFPGKKELKYILINPDEQTAAPEPVYSIELVDEALPLSEELFRNDALILDDTQIEECWICKKDGTPYVGLKSPGFPNYGIWSVKDAPFVCLEPWDGRVDNVGFAEDISKKPGIVALPAGETYQKEYRICVGGSC